MKHKTLAIDFDGTIFQKAQFPDFGNPVPFAFSYLRRFQESGFKLILWTCRSGAALESAINACKRKGIVFDAVNANLDGHNLHEPSVKVDCDFYIDDKAVGCPTLHNGAVDWIGVDIILKIKGFRVVSE